MDLLSQELTNIVSKADPRVVDTLRGRFFKDIVSSSDEKKIANRDYYVVNSNKLKNKKKEKIVCPCCLKEVNRGDKAKHMKTHECNRIGKIVTENITLREEIERLKKNKLSGNLS